MPTYHNVQGVTHGGNAITGVTSVSVNNDTQPLESQADGARSPGILGILGSPVEVTIELESQALDFHGTFQGRENVGNLVFDVQDGSDDDGTTLQRYTVTNVVFLGWNYASSQDSPNTETWTGRGLTASESISSAAVP